MFEVGKTYYIIAHSYYHYIGTVAAIWPHGVTIDNGVQVHSCQRSWTLFFRDGAKYDTRCDRVPDGTFVPTGSMPFYPWKHAIPEVK